MSEFPANPVPPPLTPPPLTPPPQQYSPAPAPPAQKNNTTKWIIGGCAGCGCLTLLGILAFIVLASVLGARENQGEGNPVTVTPPATGNTVTPSDDAPATEEATPPTNNDDQASAPADDIQNSVGQCATDPKDGMLYGRVEAVETDATTGEKTYRIAGEGGTIWHKKVENVRVGPCP